MESSGKWIRQVGWKKGEYITFHVMSRVLLIRLEIDFRHFRVITVRCGNFISMMWEFYLYDLVCLRFAQNEWIRIWHQDLLVWGWGERNYGYAALPGIIIRNLCLINLTLHPFASSLIFVMNKMTYVHDQDYGLTHN